MITDYDTITLTVGRLKTILTAQAHGLLIGFKLKTEETRNGISYAIDNLEGAIDKTIETILKQGDPSNDE